MMRRSVFWPALSLLLFAAVIGGLHLLVTGFDGNFGIGFSIGGIIGMAIAGLGFHSEYLREKRRRKDGGVDYLDEIY